MWVSKCGKTHHVRISRSWVKGAWEFSALFWWLFCKLKFISKQKIKITNKRKPNFPKVIAPCSCLNSSPVVPGPPVCAFFFTLPCFPHPPCTDCSLRIGEDWTRTPLPNELFYGENPAAQLGINPFTSNGENEAEVIKMYIEDIRSQLNVPTAWICQFIMSFLDSLKLLN